MGTPVIVRMQLNPSLFFFLFSFSSSSSSLLLPGERIEIFARALHSLIPGHGTWSEVLSLKESYLRLRAEESEWDPDNLPYFKFIPKYMLTATPGSENVPVEGTCFQNAEVTSKALKSGDVEVTLHLGLPTSLLCHASFVLALFEPCLTQGVTDYFANLNREFLSAFVGIEMPQREGAPDILEVPQELIKNGDTFDIMRLDGLDPMIAWAMGASAGQI